MGLESYEIGREGEAAAEVYLQQRGYRIIERNYRSQQGEVDLIAREGEFLVFVEVKNYSFRSYGAPAGAVRKNKRQSIIHAAQTYLYKNKINGTHCRFDVVTLYRRPDGSRAIELYKNAFMVN
ncbi:MAG: YraN family protein [Candidatus Saganbacteria bacterium]|nr:YraN family protein [Candidatus Saganbacteria bacterium]